MDNLRIAYELMTGRRTPQAVIPPVICKGRTPEQIEQGYKERDAMVDRARITEALALTREAAAQLESMLGPSGTENKAA